jgi:hypothetical protein
MIKVYFNTDSSSELVANFEDEETYIACRPSLEALAKKHKMELVESDSTYEEQEAFLEGLDDKAVEIYESLDEEPLDAFTQGKALYVASVFMYMILRNKAHIENGKEEEHEASLKIHRENIDELGQELVNVKFNQATKEEEEDDDGEVIELPEGYEIISKDGDSLLVGISIVMPEQYDQHNHTIQIGPCVYEKTRKVPKDPGDLDHHRFNSIWEYDLVFTEV